MSNTKNCCNDVNIGDIIIGKSDFDSKKIVYIDKYISYSGYDNEYIPPFSCENLDYEDIQPFSKEKLNMYKKEGYKIVDFIFKKYSSYFI